MGEHPDDLPYEELVRRKEAEEEEKRRERVRKEAEELAKHETRDILLAGISSRFHFSANKNSTTLQMMMIPISLLHIQNHSWIQSWLSPLMESGRLK